MRKSDVLFNDCRMGSKEDKEESICFIHGPLQNKSRVS